MVTPKVRCRWCEGEHTARFLCDPAAQLLQAMLREGDAGTMPTLELDEILPDNPTRLGHEPGDELLSQFVVNAGVAEVAGVPRPLLVFTGRGHDKQPLPRWTYIAGDDEVLGAGVLVTRMANLAVDTARRQRH